MSADFDKVLREARRWSVPFSVVTTLPEGALPSPRGRGGIDWEERGVLWLRASPQSDRAACELLHELAHILVDTHPSAVNEMRSPMLYLEWSTARRLKLSWWADWMHDYGMGDYTPQARTWGEVSTWVKAEALEVSRHAAEEAGLVGPEGRPTYRRPGVRLLGGPTTGGPVAFEGGI